MTHQCRQNKLALSFHKAKSLFFRVIQTLKMCLFLLQSQLAMDEPSHQQFWGKDPGSKLVLGIWFQVLALPLAATWTSSHSPLSICSLAVTIWGLNEICNAQGSVIGKALFVTCSSVYISKEVYVNYSLLLKSESETITGDIWAPTLQIEKLFLTEGHSRHKM